MGIENNLSIIKQDANKRKITGSINAKFEETGLNIIDQKQLQMNKGMTKKFYKMNKDRTVRIVKAANKFIKENTNG